MISMWTLYWLNVMFNVASLFDLLLALSIAVIVLGAPICFLTELDEQIVTFVGKYIKYPIAIMIVSVLFSIMVPSKKEALAIYMVPKVINNEQIQQLPENTLKYLNILFKKEMEEIQTTIEDK